MFIAYLGLWYSGSRVFDFTPYDPVDAAVAGGTGVATLAAVVTFWGVVPSVLWMVRRGPLSLRKVLLLGAALGNAPFVLIVVSIIVVQLVKGTLSSDVARFWYGLFGTVRAIGLGLLIGISSAALFWLIGVRGTEAERAGASY